MPEVSTATGPIDTGSLGQTLMHEHIAILPHAVRVNVPDAWDLDAVIAGCVERVQDVMTRRVRTIVDLTTVDLDRDVALVAEIARRSGCNIVVATGCWWRPPRYFASAPIERLVELWTREIREGIGGTGIRAGIIKLATHEEGVTPAIEKMLRAGARTQRATGVPISTHTDVFSRRGEDQQRIFAEEGVDLSRVIIGHSGDSTDLDYLKGLMARGSTIGMDRFGIDRITPFEQRRCQTGTTTTSTTTCCRRCATVASVRRRSTRCSSTIPGGSSSGREDTERRDRQPPAGMRRWRGQGE
jgi:phosphotriesterase-related protein